MSNIAFRPVRGSEASIKNMPTVEGSLYFATDSGKIYLDTDTERLSMGSAAGAAIFYGTADDLKEDEDSELVNISKLKVDGTPKEGDLILNKDGSFYKVSRVGDEHYVCTLLSISGTGTVGPGGVAVSKIPTITKLALESYSLIDGTDSYFDLEAQSYFEGDIPVDDVLRISVILATKQNINDTQYTPYWSTTLIYRTQENGYFDTYGVGRGYVKDRIKFKPRASTTSYLIVQVLQGEHDGPSKVKGLFEPITTSVLELKQLSSYSEATRYQTSGFNLQYNVNGAIDKKIKFYFDGVAFKPNGTGENTDFNSYESATWSPTFSIPAGRYEEDGTPVRGTATHGHHTVEVQLCQMLGNTEGNYVKPLKYELAVAGTDPNLPPIIWLGEYKEEYSTYDNIQIPFMVWDPAKTTSKTDVHLYKSDVELEGSPLQIENFSEYNYWEIADADFGQLNKYQLSCGETEGRITKREIRFTIVEDSRGMKIEEADLMLNFHATGRTNAESPAKRQSWSYKLDNETKYASFNNFNWSNNGWAMDKEVSTSYLCISNGAQLVLPYKPMIFASNTSGEQSHSVEVQFKVRNVQKYEKLISNITRYKNDSAWYAAFTDENQKEYTNYDAWLQANLSPEDYEKLEFQRVDKKINIDNVVGGLYDCDENGKVVGFCIGTQDAFFTNGTDTVNIDFVENELVNISFVYQHGLKQLYIYINGCITGVIKSTIGTDKTFTINSGEFVFNSHNCDFDLYKVRIYKKDLNVNHIIKNFAVDRRDVDTFDQNGLAVENDVLQEYQLMFSNVTKYIEDNPDKPLMPYIIFDTGPVNSRLPYSKKDIKNISVEFVNVPLEQAYMSGKLENLAAKDGLYNANTASQTDIQNAVKTYYKHHCPSFTSNIRTNDKVSFEVQGTSSEFYPRRNYKIKTKVEGNFNWKDFTDFTEEEKAEMTNEALQKLEEDGGKYTEAEKLNIFMNRGPFAEAYKNDETQVSIDPHKIGYESTRLADGWYMNNYTNPTDRWTMKVDYMESSGSYNAGFAGLVGNSYSKHPLQDYMNVMTNTSKLKPIVTTTVCDDDGMRWEDYRTSLLGFPVMAFWKRGSEADNDVIYTFIGYYRMLLDKSSTQVLGFKTPKTMLSTLIPEELNADGSVKKYKKMRDVAECWEFSNNARGYCSYRDPWSRVELSFKPPVGVKNEYTSDGAPIVANSFEYRYHAFDDYIDKLYKFDEATQAELNEVAKELGLPAGSIIKDNRASGADALLTTHTNWEKVCKWLWSTNLDAVISQGTYVKVPVGNVEYKPDGSFFYIDTAGEYKPATGDFDAKIVYYKYKRNDAGEIQYEDEAKTKPLYEPVDATTADYLYDTGKFYYLAAGMNTSSTDDDVYAISNDAYDGSIDYFEFEEGDISEFDSHFDLLVAPVNIEKDTFDAEGPIIPVVNVYPYDANKSYFTKQDNEFIPWTYTTEEAYAEAVATGLYYRDHYYTWHGTEYNAADETKRVVIKPGHATGAVRIVAEPSEADWNAGLYYKASPVTYVNKVYTHDTREYRVAKFTNEFERHFDPEYVATYFIMTEVFECYDSRGKNCMMASWGPHEQWLTDESNEYVLDNEGNKIPGDYIWYPIFYDIDTQLGINNTGIPSFEFNVDATEANNYSTSDSILWNNFYKFFKKTWMLPKYQNLRQISTSRFSPLLERDKVTSKAPLQSVDYIEKWYNFDYDVTHNLACQGIKPLIATNLDLYFKYITITNAKALDQGVAHLDDSGNYAKADGGTYFYALQGDRSQSRRQFLTSRLEYIDSWLTQKNYARGGTNRLWGRISANNTSGEDVHSDKWVENTNNPYWVDREFGTKSHEFDAEYWLELKPIRSSYVTAGDDSANYPSEKYDGINKMYFVLDELENGIRISNNYPEQLLYVYGTNQMSDFGDLSKMYWTEFKLEGEADKLTRLKLGHDGLDKDGNGWYNRKLNGITLPDLPLLKEANFCNINITADKRDLNLTASEKLENFRATGSNINSILFAKGVALNTLYLPSSVTALSLEQANLLTDLITEYEVPVNKNGQLEATPGLYLEGFFEEGTNSALSSISFKGGSLGYNSYAILKQLYNKGTGDITMQDVVWCPYTKLTEGDIYEDDKVYYKDNGHYGFEEYTNTDEKQFNADILSGVLYRDDGFGGRNGNNFSNTVLGIDDDAITMLKMLYNNATKFHNASGLNHPEITGVIYINNDDAIDEGVLNSGDLAAGKIGIGNLQQYYPNLTFFFKNVNKAYSAKFVLFNEEDYSESFVKWIDGSTSPSVQKIQSYGTSVYFSNPFTQYKPEKTHYVFKGWSLDNRSPYDADGNLLPSVITVDNPSAWDNLRLTEGKYDYTFYAIFEIRKYDFTFYNHDGSAIVEVLHIPYDTPARVPDKIPYRDDSQLNLYESYNFKGYSFSQDGPIVDISTITVSNNEEFYSCFELIEDIRTVTHPEWFTFTPTSYEEGTYVPGSTYTISGYDVKPAMTLQGKVVIPRSYNGQPIVSLSKFIGSNITHIFMEKSTGNSTIEKPVTEITSSAFMNVSSLKYFDFENSNLRHVSLSAFQNCSLDAAQMTLHNAPLQVVEYYGFNSAIASSVKTALLIPSSLIVAGAACFAYLKCAQGTDLIIGSEASPSKLDFTLGGASETFIQNRNRSFGSVTFYSDLYDEGDTVNGEDIQVFFGTNMNSFAIH